MARPATGRTTVIKRRAVIAWAVAVVAAADVAVMIDEGATHVDVVADRHRTVSGTNIVAEAEADRVRAALANYAKVVASSAMRKATSSATARNTAEAAGQ